MQPNTSPVVPIVRSIFMAIGVILFVTLGARGLSDISDKSVVTPKPHQDIIGLNDQIPIFTNFNQTPGETFVEPVSTMTEPQPRSDSNTSTQQKVSPIVTRGSNNANKSAQPQPNNAQAFMQASKRAVF